jgi:hypothetical protein
MNVAYSPEELKNNIVLTRRAHLIDGSRQILLSNEELKNVISSTVDDFIYVQFICDNNIQINVNTWNCSECLNKSTLIVPN